MKNTRKNPPLIDVRQALPFLGRPGLLSRIAHRSFRKGLAFDEVERLIRRAMEENDSKTENDFFLRLLDLLDIRLETEGSIDSIPTTGPVVVLSNHPFGGVDAVSLAHLLTTHRADTRILANQLLADIPPARPWLLAADLLGEKHSAVRKNAMVLRQFRRHLQQGGLLMTFPAGVVSHLHLKSRQIKDPPWPDHVAAIVRRSSATIIPVFFSGRNSLFFQGVGLIHPLLRSTLMAREFIRKRGATVRVSIGRPIPPESWDSDLDTSQFNGYLRSKVEELGQKKSAGHA